MMRVPAVPQHVICTGQFLGLAPPELQQQRRSAFARGAGGTALAEENAARERRQQARELVAQVTGPVERLGVCGLPVPSATGPVTQVEGFLLESAATAERVLEDVLDSFPDSVWAEWQTGVQVGAPHDMLAGSAAPRNPLESATHGGFGAGRSMGGAGRSAEARHLAGALAPLLLNTAATGATATPR